MRAIVAGDIWSAGDLQQLTFPAPASFTYDSHDRLTSIVEDGNHVISLAYNTPTHARPDAISEYFPAQLVGTSVDVTTGSPGASIVEMDGWLSVAPRDVAQLPDGNWRAPAAGDLALATDGSQFVALHTFAMDYTADDQLASVSEVNASWKMTITPVSANDSRPFQVNVQVLQSDGSTVGQTVQFNWNATDFSALDSISYVNPINTPAFSVPGWTTELEMQSAQVRAFLLPHEVTAITRDASGHMVAIEDDSANSYWRFAYQSLGDARPSSASRATNAEPSGQVSESVFVRYVHQMVTGFL